MWRKAVSLAMAAAVILSLTACSGKSFYEALGEAVGEKGGEREPEGEGYFPTVCGAPTWTTGRWSTSAMTLSGSVSSPSP